jgi:hypothetical protein
MTDGQPVIDEWKQICENKDKFFFSVFTDEILQEFHAWRMEQSAENQTFSFWDNQYVCQVIWNQSLVILSVKGMK